MCIFLAPAHHQLGHRARARDFYRRAVDGMPPLPTSDLVCPREEAEQVPAVDLTTER